MEQGSFSQREIQESKVEKIRLGQPSAEASPLKKHLHQTQATSSIQENICSLETKIIAIVNQKGGVGKTTTAINLCACLAELNKRVLLVDIDPQGNATAGLGVDRTSLSYCIYKVLIEEEPIEKALIELKEYSFDLLPATIDLAGAEIELVPAFSRELRLKKALSSLIGRYDYIYIDCPPSLGLLTINALAAADEVIIPVQCEYYALEGLSKLLDSLRLVKSNLNPGLEIGGMVMTMHDRRTNLSKQVINEIVNFFHDKAFHTIVPRSVRLSEAPSYGQPIILYAPSSTGANAYRRLAKEVIDYG